MERLGWTGKVRPSRICFRRDRGNAGEPRGRRVHVDLIPCLIRSYTRGWARVGWFFMRPCGPGRDVFGSKAEGFWKPSRLERREQSHGFSRGYMNEPSKHTVYYELLDACTKGGCPLCTMALDTVARYLDIVIYENVNDPQTRDAVVAARGYCNDHSWQLRAKSGAAFGTALMYRDVLQHVAEEIGRHAAGGHRDIFTTDRNDGGLLERLAKWTGRSNVGGKGHDVADPHRACPACQTRERYELIYLGVLLDHLGEEDVTQALHSTGGLCLVHLDQASAASRHARALERLWDVQCACMQALDQELREFIRKHDYRFTGEGMGTEGTSWIRAIEMVAGKQGIR
jgi:Family of unknown function (DUF6062)